MDDEIHRGPYDERVCVALQFKELMNGYNAKISVGTAGLLMQTDVGSSSACTASTAAISVVERQKSPVCRAASSSGACHNPSVFFAIARLRRDLWRSMSSPRRKSR